MDAGDQECVEWLTRTIGSFFAASDQDADAVAGDVTTRHAKNLRDFITLPACCLLQAYLVKTNATSAATKVQLSNKIVNPLAASNSSNSDGNSSVVESWRALVFAKPRAVKLSVANVDTAVVSVTIGGGSSLAHSFNGLLHNLLCPVLMQEGVDLAPSLKSLLAELELGLTQLHASTQIEADLLSIQTLSDEFMFWKNMKEQKKPELNEKYMPIFKEIQKISESFTDIISKSHAQLLQILNSTKTCIQRLWKLKRHKYSELRMWHLFTLIENELVSFVQRKFPKSSLWSSHFSQVYTSLMHSYSLLNHWADIKLTLIKPWRENAEHTWMGQSHHNMYFDLMQERLQTILKIRSLHQQIITLIPPSNIPPGIFSPFESFHPLHCDPMTCIKWQACPTKLFFHLIHLQQRSALHAKWSKYPMEPIAVLLDVIRYNDILCSTSLLSALESERRVLLSRASTNITDHTKSLLWVNQLQSMVQFVENFSSTHFLKVDTVHLGMNLFSDLDSLAEISSLLQALESEMRAYLNELFDSWCQKVENTLGLKWASFSGSLIEFVAGKAQVRLTPAFQIIEERSQFISLGFSLPENMNSFFSEFEDLHRQWILLKQITNHYNALLTQVILCQKAMISPFLQAFEEKIILTLNVEPGQWSSSTAETHIENLHNEVQFIAEKIRHLRKVHYEISAKVNLLFHTDLSSHWSEIVQEIHALVDNLDTEGYKGSDMTKLHWDHQIYKALDFQYRRSLETLIDTLPNIKCDLVYEHQRLIFRPPIEILRTTYYNNVQKFIRFPYTFLGMGNSNLMYLSIVEKNRDNLISVFKNAEELLAALHKEKEQFIEWTSLDLLDLDTLVDENIKKVEEWEYNFRIVQAKLQQVDHLPNEKKLGCLTVSFTPVKATIEDHLNNLLDSLVSSLGKSIRLSIAKIDNFLDTSITFLSESPSTLAQMTEVGVEYNNIALEYSKSGHILQEIDEKNRLLCHINGSGIDLATLQNKWVNLEYSLSMYKQMTDKKSVILKQETDQHAKVLQTCITKLAKEWASHKPNYQAVSDKKSALAAMEVMLNFSSKFQEIQGEADILSSERKQFGIIQRPIPGLQELDHDITQHALSWNLYKTYMEEKKQIGKSLWTKFRIKRGEFSDFINRWQHTTKKALKQKQVHEYIASWIRQDLEKSQNLCPLLQNVRGEAFSSEHWHTLFLLVDIHITDISQLQLKHFLSHSANMFAHERQIKELQARAKGEIAIREAIEDLKLWANSTTFSMYEHEDGARTTPLIKDWKELLSSIGDHQAVLASLKDTQYYKIFADQVHQWEMKLGNLDHYIHTLNTVQRKWVYLKPIFAQGALPHEEDRFSSIDSKFVDIVTNLALNRQVMQLVEIPGIGETLHVLEEQLERCQNALSNYLEEKRSLFPRFYFLGDDDLLEILGQAKKPSVIQAHLKKLFQGLHQVNFSPDSKDIVSIGSGEGEIVPLRNPVAVSLQVEGWLNALAVEMVNTLKASLPKCLQNSNFDDFPCQILCLADSINFTYRCESALESQTSSKPTLLDIKADLYKALATWTVYSTETKTQLSKLKSIILDIIHNRDVVELLLCDKVSHISEWAWQKQLRYYFQEGVAAIHMGEGIFSYSYEYQGNAPKLVYTPLTDKAYLTLTQGIMRGFGGNPYGPAGTGKTESVKALGQILGRHVLVFNCDEGIDFQSMGRMFTGIVKCGAWGCFDEFNRLDEEVLSAVSQQIQTIQGALKNVLPNVQLLDKVVEVNRTSGIFVTMNPAGKGYGGRSKLPDNLKQLFRPVAMSAPDLTMIAEVILLSEGFTHAKELGLKLVSIFSLCKQLLSAQQHYDWGLRALKSILTMGGSQVQEERKRSNKCALDKNIEQAIIVRALHLSTASKLVQVDALRFQGLISDVFQDSQINLSLSSNLFEKIQECLLKKQLAISQKRRELSLGLKYFLSLGRHPLIEGGPGLVWWTK
ncbi:Cytoplasmic dynein 2 heavy chain 1 [Pelomyxa schiedti]|nr:Cytoplasmic dynein 2 heavy chain 1 [Pelomyxa schiedti]